MANQPFVPRNSSIVGPFGNVSRDWDQWFQNLAQTVNLLTPSGTFANNAAAIAGGLLVGQMYQTATGEVRIVV